jgi:phosphoribosylamine-glycine ligase
MCEQQSFVFFSLFSVVPGKQTTLLESSKKYAGDFMTEDVFRETLYNFIERTEDWEIYPAQLIPETVRQCHILRSKEP